MTRPSNFGRGTDANKQTPASAGSVGQLKSFWATDTNKLYVDNKDNTAWIEIPTGSSGASLSVTDGTTTETSVSSLTFSGATVTSTGSGEATVVISGGSGGAVINAQPVSIVQKSTGMALGYGSTLSLATAATAGNLLVLFYAGGRWPNPPSGYQQLLPYMDNQSQTTFIWTKISDGTETSIAVSGGDNGQWMLYELANCHGLKWDGDGGGGLQFSSGTNKMYVPGAPVKGAITFILAEYDSSTPLSMSGSGITQDFAGSGGGNHCGAIGHTSLDFHGDVTITAGTTTNSMFSWVWAYPLSPGQTIINSTPTMDFFSPSGGSGPALAHFTSTVASGMVVDMVDLANTRGVSMEFKSTGGLSAATLMSDLVIPDGDFSYKTLISSTAYIGGQGFGIALKDSSGKIRHWGSRNGDLGGSNWSSVDSVDGGFSYIGGGLSSPLSPTWFKIERVGSNFLFSISADGETWALVSTENATDYLGGTISSVGLLLYSNAAFHYNVTCYALELGESLVSVGGGAAVGTAGSNSNGYYEVRSSGVIEQWGKVTSTHSGEGGVAITFPIAFTNSDSINIQLVELNDGTADNDMWMQVDHTSWTTTGFTAYYAAPSGGNNGYGFMWRAIGM